MPGSMWRHGGPRSEHWFVVTMREKKKVYLCVTSHEKKFASVAEQDTIVIFNVLVVKKMVFFFCGVLEVDRSMSFGCCVCVVDMEAWRDKTQRISRS